VTLLEVGFSTRNGPEHRVTLGEPPISFMSVEHLTPAIEVRAVEIQMLLADRGQHRAPSIPDLFIAATAEIARLTVLHIDKDFDLIAAITGQAIERLEV
jgi:predicted nucleic acid-binding protein